MRSEVLPQPPGDGRCISCSRHPRSPSAGPSLRSLRSLGREPAASGFARSRLASALCSLAALACSGTAHQISIAPPPPRDTHAVLTGGLCQDNRCTCRGDAGDGGVGVPETPDRKRYEVRLGPTPYDLWVTVDKTTVLYKTPERAE